MNLVESPDCDLCPHGVEGDLQHCLLNWEHNNVVNEWIIGVLIDIDPGLEDYNLSGKNIITLDLPIDVDKRLSVLFFFTSVFGFIWKMRQAKKPVCLTEVHAMTLAEVSLLKNSQSMLNQLKQH